MAMHDDQLEISDDTARALITNQFPEWAHEGIRRIHSSGTVNAIFRIGEILAARFPLRAADPERTRRILERQARASTEFARHAPFRAPVPVALGEPALDYPLPWSVQTWVPGSVATAEVPGSDDFARDLAKLITALRTVDTEGRRFEGPGRGGDLHDHDEWVETCLHNSEHLLDVAQVRGLWSQLRDLPRTDPDVMTHGDLIPGNLLLEGGRLVGVLDSGGFGPADPSLDVIAGWHMLDRGPRAVFRRVLACNDLEWERSKAWALVQAISALWYYVDSNPAMSTMGRRTLGRVLADNRI